MKIMQRQENCCSMDTEELDESQEAYFIHLPYLKRIYLAMLNGDGQAWNEQLAKRINQYRKRPY